MERIHENSRSQYTADTACETDGRTETAPPPPPPPPPPPGYDHENKNAASPQRICDVKGVYAPQAITDTVALYV